MDPESGLRRLFGISGHFVSLLPSPPKPDNSKAPSTAGLGEEAHLNSGITDLLVGGTQQKKGSKVYVGVIVYVLSVLDTC